MNIIIVDEQGNGVRLTPETVLRAQNKARRELLEGPRYAMPTDVGILRRRARQAQRFYEWLLRYMQKQEGRIAELEDWVEFLENLRLDAQGESNA